MWPVSIGTEEQGWVGGCGVTPARRVNPKTKPFEIPTLHHCQHCPLPAGAWHGPSTPPVRPLPTPAVSILGGGTEGYCAEGDSFVFGHSCPGLGRGPTASPDGGERREGMERTGAHGSVHHGGDLSHWGTSPSPSERAPQQGGQRVAPRCPQGEAPAGYAAFSLPSGAGAAWGRPPASVSPCRG